MTWLAPDGFRVDVVNLSHTSGNSEDDWLRVKQHGVLRGQYRTVADLHQAHPGLVDKLVEKDDLYEG